MLVQWPGEAEKHQNRAWPMGLSSNGLGPTDRKRDKEDTASVKMLQIIKSLSQSRFMDRVDSC